jgi:hypothetical protein
MLDDPVLKIKEPLTPSDPASGESTVKDPLLEVKPSPLVSEIDPPVTSELSPELNEMREPVPMSPDADETLTLPPVPLVACPD